MASPRVGSVPPKMSFAKVAAMNVPNPSKTSSNITEEKKPQKRDPVTRRSTVISSKPQITSPPAQTTPQPPKAEVIHLPESNNDVAIEGLSLVSYIPPPSNGFHSVDSLDDDQSHLSGSSTKQQSFETKSMASVTTFAMDEKESIRPDDSASVRAVDDEDLASTLSRNSTFNQESSVIMPTLRGGAGMIGPSINLAARRYPTLTNPPRFGDLDPPPPPQSDVSETASSVPLPQQHDDSTIPVPPPPVSPDEKLLDALASPKDRLAILQLEERLLAFISQSAIDFFDLPPQNSYARLLAHKLADYYGLLHPTSDDNTSIRIFRTPSASLPTPLTVLAKSIPVGSSQSLPNAVKIMRRGGLGARQLSTTNSTAPSSSAPSKATSEAGHSEEAVTSPTDAGTPNREKTKMSREEREAQYKAARERIFGDFQEFSISENLSTGDNSASMSRSSSSSGKKKIRRQKAPKDDTFDSRSAFVAGYDGVHMQPVQTQFQQPQQQYVDQPYQNQFEAMSNPYGQPMNYGTTPTQAYPGFEQSIPMTSPPAFSPMSPQNFNLVDNWNQQSQPGTTYFSYAQLQGSYQQPTQPMVQQMNNQLMQQPQQVPVQQQMWPANQYQNPYQQQQPPVSSQVPQNWANFQQQQYSQLPNQMVMNNPLIPQASQMPHYNRSLFNPQTRSFVPGTGGRPGPKNRKKHSPAPQNQAQSRNSSGTKSHTTSAPVATNMLPSRAMVQDRSSSLSSLNPNEESLQKKYGAPANLPKKPPPSQVLSHFDAGGLSTVKPPSAVVGINGNAQAGSGSEKVGGAEEAASNA